MLIKQKNGCEIGCARRKKVIKVPIILLLVFPYSPQFIIYMTYNTSRIHNNYYTILKCTITKYYFNLIVYTIMDGVIKMEIYYMIIHYTRTYVRITRAVCMIIYRLFVYRQNYVSVLLDKYLYYDGKTVKATHTAWLRGCISTY